MGLAPSNITHPPLDAEGASAFKLVKGSINPQEKILQETTNDRFMCVICHQLMTEPVSANPCGHCFDEDCLWRWLHVRGTQHNTACCPRACGAVITGFIKSPDMRLLISESVKTRCMNEGCGLIMTLDLLPAHLEKTCEYSMFMCELTDDAGKTCCTIVRRGDMAKHRSCCPYVKVACGYPGCQLRPPRYFLDTHKEKCPMMPVHCKCGQDYVLKDKVAHSKTCPVQPVACSICAEKLPRSQIDAHMGDPVKMASHLKTLARRVAALTTENQQLKRDLKKQPTAARPAWRPRDVIELSEGATCMVQIVDTVELRWQADMKALQKEGDRLESPTFTCGGWVFYLLLRVCVCTDAEIDMGLFMGSNGAAKEAVSDVNITANVHVVNVQAECTLEIDESGVQMHIKPQSRMQMYKQAYGVPNGIKVPKGQAFLKASVRMNKVIVHYSRGEQNMQQN